MDIMKEALMRLTRREHLDGELAHVCFDGLFQGDISQVQAGAFLLGLRIKGETASEIASAAEVALSHARLVNIERVAPVAIDTCGTGGDGKKSFNCSTAVSLYLADMGYKVVKHGNRAISGNCGSADVIRALGIPFPEEERDVLSLLERTNFAFLFAPTFHPAFSRVAPLRQELAVPTIFNLLGPLLNPAMPSHQLLGVGDERYLLPMATVLRDRGVHRAAVVHGNGYDEITPTGDTRVILISSGEMKELIISPESLGISRCREEDLRCENREEAISLMERVLLGGLTGPVRDMVAMNLAMALFLLEEDISLEEAMDISLKKLEQGIDRGRFYVT